MCLLNNVLLLELDNGSHYKNWLISLALKAKIHIVPLYLAN